MIEIIKRYEVNGITFHKGFLYYRPIIDFSQLFDSTRGAQKKAQPFGST